MSMSRMLLSIKPEHVANIISGIKRYEFRKVRCRDNISSIIIYATSPVMRVIGEVEILDVIEDIPKIVWNKTADYAGISSIFFNKYYEGKNKAVAYRLGKVNVYKEPRLLNEYGVKAAPQSFIYLS